MRVKNKEENPAAVAATNSFLERKVEERKYDNPKVMSKFK